MAKKKATTKGKPGKKAKAGTLNTTHAEMHAEHRQWFSDSSLWRDDLAAWQHELKTALKQIGELEAALQKHGERLNQHAAAIRLHEQTQAEHENALADYEKGGDGLELTSMARGHLQEAAKHGEQRQAHESLKRHHHALIAQFNLLRKAVAAKIS